MAQKDPAAVSLGRRGGQVSGILKGPTVGMTAKQKAAHMRMMAKARWGKTVKKTDK
jgi:hypothetical protein